MKQKGDDEMDTENHDGQGSANAPKSAWIYYIEAKIERCILAVRERKWVLVDLDKRVWLNFGGEWRWGGGLSATRIEDEPSVAQPQSDEHFTVADGSGSDD
jgi:hypothetical protein